MGACSNCPMAAATRSSVRVVPYPMIAVLSCPLRSLLLVLGGAASVRFFFLNGPLVSPCAACSPAPSAHCLSPVRSCLRPAAVDTPPAPPRSVPVKIASCALHRTLHSLFPGALSHTASP